MTQDMTVPGISPEQQAMIEAMRQGMQTAVAERPAYSSTPLLRMLKGDAAWVYGPDDIEVEAGSIWAVNPLQCAHGYVCWAQPEKGAKPSEKKLGEAMVLMSARKPDKASLPDKPGGTWSDQVGLQLKCMTGEDTGLEVVFKSNSSGGLDGGMAVVGAILKRMSEGVAAIVPKVRLTSSNYQHASWGKIHKPIFEIIGWVTLDGSEVKDLPKSEGAAATGNGAEPHSEPEAAAAPSRSRSRAATPAAETGAAAAPAADAAEQPPARRRRAV